jgi:hypothetical protein
MVPLNLPDARTMLWDLNPAVAPLAASLYAGSAYCGSAGSVIA